MTSRLSLGSESNFKIIKNQYFVDSKIKRHCKNNIKTINHKDKDSHKNKKDKNNHKDSGNYLHQISDSNKYK